MPASITLQPSEYHRTSVDAGGLSDWEAVLREEAEATASLFAPMMAGIIVLVIGVGGFFLWAANTNVAQASAAAGRVVAESNTKTVTHLEGGTLKAVLVDEGSRVKQGDLLATLDVTRSQATVIQLRQQLLVLDIRLTRLLAEKDENPRFSYDKPLPIGVNPATAAQLISTEAKLFQERRSQFHDQLATDQSLIDQIDSQIAALVGRRKASIEQAAVMHRDYDAMAKLESQQLVTTSALNEKKLLLMDMEARIAESDASIAEGRQRRSQAELSMSNRRTEYFRTISEAIQQAQADMARANQDLISAEDVVAKSEIRSPQDGVVANIKVRTPGSAVIGGQPILDIVPNHQPMVIEGSIRATDIDAVHIGERTEIRLETFGYQEALPLIGHVTYVAADTVVDERTGVGVYPFRVKIDDGELAKQPNLFLYPGMTANVSIINGSRSALAYLAMPIFKSFHGAFRER
jgi:HlyD family secretion protein